MDGTILVGIDGSVASRAAITWAIARAGDLETGVSLLSVVDDEWGTISDRDLAELRTDTERVATRELAFARGIADGVPVSATVEVGAPMLELAATASRHESVVIGSHKTGTFHGHALGSRGLQLAAVAPVPIAVVPVTSMKGRSGVVVGAGTAPGWIEAVRFAMGEAVRLGEPLTVLRSAQGVPFGEQALGSLLDAGDEAESSVDVMLHRSTAPAGEALANASHRAVLTISGRPTEHGARGYRPLGRTNSDLLMNVGGPVIIVPHLTGA
ncbi:universal stress protein [Agromyces sp. Marseille-P2726]|uniref:universal stress protein n=1 Tax=Agromyces sp. Marseille-P2726 TaxID=2709132 RepID=UPI0015703EFF|nr:universal stress protein [Agromyces sp. Marseille-P2726]